MKQKVKYIFEGVRKTTQWVNQNIISEGVRKTTRWVNQNIIFEGVRKTTHGRKLNEFMTSWCLSMYILSKWISIVCF